MTALCLVSGFTIVADSAQCSACVPELAGPSYPGTAAMQWLQRLPEARKLAGGRG